MTREEFLEHYSKYDFTENEIENFLKFGDTEEEIDLLVEMYLKGLEKSEELKAELHNVLVKTIVDFAHNNGYENISLDSTLDDLNEVLLDLEKKGKKLVYAHMIHIPPSLISDEIFYKCWVDIIEYTESAKEEYGKYVEDDWDRICNEKHKEYLERNLPTN